MNPLHLLGFVATLAVGFRLFMVVRDCLEGQARIRTGTGRVMARWDRRTKPAGFWGATVFQLAVVAFLLFLCARMVTA
ncbi:hypothetical protein [Novosphingobium sp. 9]|uniref:hypothetical protein n=1 Tax=Novosphingobium sp. 9 TaxID=2025349 RepID=UPI0021B56749|nr:hypothetical protein [Novosphingobium sp. 9]